jgi:dolichol-phosphate mannosyltransferase
VNKVSIIIPTYCEAANLRSLVAQVHEALSSSNIDAEILIVDDNSPDGTPSVCEELSRKYPVALHVRHNERGLATAVLAGMKIAKGDVFVVMDADLQHPPQAIPDLIAMLRDPSIDAVIGSRFTTGGQIDGAWSAFRRILSKASALLARPLVCAKDPCAGFFAIRRSTFDKACNLKPVGYRVGLELMVKGGCRKVKEVPIHFATRAQGASKLTFQVMALYLRHLARLYWYRLTTRHPHHHAHIPA